MMPIIKKNILSIVCGVLVIAAVVVYFVWVSGSLYPDLEASAKQRKSQYDTLNNLLGKSRTMPVIDLKNTQPVPLPCFPTTEVIEQAKQVTTKLTGQSAQILKLATELNQHKPLIDGVFPKPNDTAKLLFRDAYARYVTNGIPEMLNAARPPSEEDVQERETKLWDEKYAKMIYYVNGAEANREQVDQQYLAEIAGLRQQIEKERAQQHTVYLDQTAVTTNQQLWKSEASPPDAQVWYAQMALWVQEDILKSIKALNDRVLEKKPKNEQNIVNAPVKHIVTVDVPQGAEMYFRITDTSVEGIQAGAQDFQSSPTGRTSGPVYDVIKFSLVVKMDAHYLPTLIQDLARGKFITVHKVDTTTVDPNMARDEGFYYGESPIVQATLSGEALMLRDWTLKLVPEVVKKDLPGNTPAAGGEGSTDTAAAH
jgi:hypothetical protein